MEPLISTHAEAAQTWTPEGVTITQRFQALVNAIVIVYTADAGADGVHYAMSCLGCDLGRRTGPDQGLLTQDGARELANSHAAQCRALLKPLPNRPDDEAARRILRTTLDHMRRTDRDIDAHLTNFHLDRPALQRPTSWIKAELEHLARTDPDFLTAEPRDYDDTSLRYVIRRPAPTVERALVRQ
ncbi:hypothetical protein ACIOG4_28565 [Streptomyces microflavus]|uniref:hypothetical protein n=1 Tax=Streptomyces microflavus TaxID=1919 RepID=UPI0037F8C3D9